MLVLQDSTYHCFTHCKIPVLMVPIFEACDETPVRQKYPKTQIFLLLTTPLQKYGHNSFIFIVAKFFMCYLVHHTFPVWMVYDSSCNHEMAACFSEIGFIFPDFLLHHALSDVIRYNFLCSHVRRLYSGV